MRRGETEVFFISGKSYDEHFNGNFRCGEIKTVNEPPHDKTNNMTCAPSEDSVQTAQSDQSSLST